MCHTSTHGYLDAPRLWRQGIPEGPAVAGIESGAQRVPCYDLQAALPPMQSVAARMSAAFAVALVAFGLAAFFAVWRMRALGSDLRLVSQAYLPLTRIAAEIDVKEGALTRALELRALEPATRRALLPGGPRPLPGGGPGAAHRGARGAHPRPGGGEGARRRVPGRGGGPGGRGRCPLDGLRHRLARALRRPGASRREPRCPGAGGPGGGGAAAGAGAGARREAPAGRPRRAGGGPRAGGRAERAAEHAAGGPLRLAGGGGGGGGDAHRPPPAGAGAHPHRGREGGGGGRPEPRGGGARQRRAGPAGARVQRHGRLPRPAAAGALAGPSAWRRWGASPARSPTRSATR